MVALSRNVGAKHAMEMLLTGEMVPAARAAEIGLVNAVVHDAGLTDHVTAVAHKIASKSPVTLAIGKSAFYTQRELSIADAYEYASRVMVENMLHRDAVEGIDAFIEKREPKW
jgi:enoyl-CoA hydratase/carnithine racemase